MAPLTTESQSWLDSSLFPFESKFQRLSTGKMHYVDEGEGEVILFVHGTPTWSFLYRDFIKRLSANYRCIAIDHLGFGLSEKMEDKEGDPAWHATNLIEFMDRLELENVTMVVHDFGGSIGLTAALDNPSRIKQIVLFNSWLWKTSDNPTVQKADKLMRSSMGKFLYLNLNISVRILLKKGFSNKRNLSRAIHQHYLEPFPTKNSRRPLLEIARALYGSSDWYEERWKELHALEDKKWLILWGADDKFITEEFLERWKKRLPNAIINRFECGHFVPEEKPEEAIREIELFMRE